MIEALAFENADFCRLKRFPASNLFTTRAAGNMSPQWGNKQKARTKATQIFTRYAVNPHDCFVVFPAHSDRIVCVLNDNDPREILCDGIFTALPHAAIVLRPADCLPILMTTVEKKFIGLIHVGWRGIENEIIRNAVQRAKLEYEVSENDIHVGIGPSIHRCCYNNDYIINRYSEDKRWLPFMSTGPLGTRVDLVGRAVQQLLLAGIDPVHITILAACTMCTKNKSGEYLFFSHHRVLKNKSEKEGRGMALITF